MDQTIPTFRERLTRFILLCGALSAVSLVIIITQRLSNDALSLTIGIVIGLVALGPALWTRVTGVVAP